jgi:hypothetical protein
LAEVRRRGHEGTHAPCSRLIPAGLRRFQRFLSLHVRSCSVTSVPYVCRAWEALVVMDSIEQQHTFIRNSLVDVAQKCERRGIDPEIVVQTIISVGVTLAVTSCDTEDVARLLESMAASVRSGDFTDHRTGDAGTGDWLSQKSESSHASHGRILILDTNALRVVNVNSTTLTAQISRYFLGHYLEAFVLGVFEGRRVMSHIKPGRSRKAINRIFELNPSMGF